VGFNFEFEDPIRIIQEFYCVFWEYTKFNYALNNNQALKEVYKRVFYRFILLAQGVAQASSILPVALYFEPEEIAISSLSIAQQLFRFSFPTFVGQCSHKELEKINQVNADPALSAEDKLSGEQIIRQFWHHNDFIHFDFSKNFLDI